MRARYQVPCPLLVMLIVGLPTVYGSWGLWGDITACSVSCGQGSQSQMRTWVPGPDDTPLEKAYTSQRSFGCTAAILIECPVNGNWTQWYNWGPCNKACGRGIKQRVRECYGRKHGGKDCRGKDMDTQTCNRALCPTLPLYFNMSQCKERKNFTCASGKMCVPMSNRCDDTVQCHDGSDELECGRRWAGRSEIRYGLSIGGGGSFVQASLIVGSLLTIVTVMLCH